MPSLLPDIDPDGLLEYSVVYTDRALNHMSQRFIRVMQDLVAGLNECYSSDGVAIVPGSGTTGMEAVVRQLARDKRCLIVRNGYFSYRWSQLLETARLTKDITVCKARRIADKPESPFIPAPIDEVTAAIRERKPQMVFVPHVETASGMLLPDDYLKAVAKATHEAGGLFVLDCIASGAMWVDMKAIGVDILVSAPQKGWSSTPCCAMVMVNDRARAAIAATDSDSFAMDLKKWLSIADGYVKGQHAYHATMPTDGLVHLRDTMLETKSAGFAKLRERQQELGSKVRALLKQRGFASVAAEGFEAPGVIVCYTKDPDIRTGKKFAQAGIQSAAGVPLQCDEPADFSTFRVGLFGLEKLGHVDATVKRLAEGLDRMGIKG